MNDALEIARGTSSALITPDPFGSRSYKGFSTLVTEINI
jgi:hypothetical protein